MNAMPRVGQRVRFGAINGTVTRVFPDILKAEVMLDSGISVCLDIVVLQDLEERP